MGGNSSVISKTGELVPAQKIRMDKVGRNNFTTEYLKVLEILDKKFKTKYKKSLFHDFNTVKSGTSFNGSSCTLFNPNVSDEEYIKYKKTTGDVDVIVPEEVGEDLYNLLRDIQGDKITPITEFVGILQKTWSAVGGTIIAVFKTEFKDCVSYPQIDFELLEHKDGIPSAWSKFSKSSDWGDVRLGIKGFHHKFLISAIAGSISMKPDIVIATPSSTCDKLKLVSGQKAKEIPRMIKFGVERGVRTAAYEPLLDNDGKQCTINGKHVYKEKNSKTDIYETDLDKIFVILFGEPKDKSDVDKMWSFTGLIELVKKYFPHSLQQTVLNRYLEMLWGSGRQAIEMNNEDDYNVKKAAFEFLRKELKGKVSDKEVQSLIKSYYKMNESFKSYINGLKFI